MKVAWVTPFFRDSAVGELGGRIAAGLARLGHDVTIFGCGTAPYIATDLPFVPVGERDRIDPIRLRAFDLVIYNVANHGSSFPIYWALQRAPGIVILCDRVYVHGLDAYAQNVLRDPVYFERLAAKYYGEAGVAFVRRFRSGTALPEELERYTFMEAILDGARGALVHSHEFEAVVRGIWNGPVGRIQGFAPPAHPTTPVPPRSAFGVGNDDFLIAFLGYIAPVRALELLFEVLSHRPDLAGRTKVAVVGRTESEAYANHLRERATNLGVDGIVRWHFNASDDVKHSILSLADAAYNFRLLNSEGSSGSLIEQMSYALPVIVNANGFAREAPGDAVCFVEREDMGAGVERVLEMLVADPQRRKAIGARALAWVEDNGSTQTYAQAILDLAGIALPVRPARPPRPSPQTLPLVSIAITSYNYGRYIADAIRSSMAQTYENVEIVVSDNASTDDTVEIVKRLAAIDPRIRLIINETNVGMLENFRLVRQACRGEYVVFLSADDVLFPQHVGSAIAYYYAHPECDILHRGFAIIGRTDSHSSRTNIPEARAFALSPRVTSSATHFPPTAT